MAAVWCLSLVGVLATALPSDRLVHYAERDSWNMTVIASLFCMPYPSVPCADADRDGRQEFYASIWLGPDIWAKCAIEHIGDNRFDTTEIAMPLWTGPEGIGDADRDGLSELILHGQYLYLFESPDSFSLPTRCVWVESIEQSGAYHPSVVDLDADSAREIVIGLEQGGPWLYECTGDNQYEHKCNFPPLRLEYPICAQCPDMDRDGRVELAVGFSRGLLAFYESVANDSVAFRDTIRLLSGTINCWCQAVTPAPDLDHDGRPEVLASCFSLNQGMSTLAVLESPCDDSFEIVWADTVAGGDQSASISIGDIHGDSTLEFAVADGASVRLYRCIGNDQYECTWESDSTGPYNHTRLYDINSDGRDELIQDYRDSVLIREWLSSGAEERMAERLKQVEVQPSVVRGSGVVHVTGLPQSAGVDVVDASGRVIASGSSDDSSFVLGTLDLKAGAYFIRIRLGNQSVVRKVLVVD